ncbi:Kinase [Hexamita inflata]|uniref:cyclin-dependent kinase n=1 Tax=Hexamita inflata TaxID=28002 RepID=A0AA86QES7_9EUKA|nr:CMGC CDKL [Hexamita inflata]
MTKRPYYLHTQSILVAIPTFQSIFDCLCNIIPLESCMNKYNQLEQIGEGTYGIVLKCQNKETNEYVAIKKFKEPADPNDPQYLKITSREVQMLYDSKHPFIVRLIEAFKRKVRMYFVFEYCESTVLDLMGKITERDCKLLTLQLLHSLQYLHQKHIVHRDVKPENLLVTYVNKHPILKLCDFGFARSEGGMMTDYVATRWYRAPELLLNSKAYGPSVDVWAVGCLLFELLTSQPLFPGDTDFNTLQMICAMCGGLVPAYQQLFQRNPKYTGLKLNVKPIDFGEYITTRLQKARMSTDSVQILLKILKIDSDDRPNIYELVQNPYFDEVRTEVQQYEEYWYKKENIKPPVFDQEKVLQDMLLQVESTRSRSPPSKLKASEYASDIRSQPILNTVQNVSLAQVHQTPSKLQPIIKSTPKPFSIQTRDQIPDKISELKEYQNIQLPSYLKPKTPQQNRSISQNMTPQTNIPQLHAQMNAKSVRPKIIRTDAKQNGRISGWK